MKIYYLLKRGFFFLVDTILHAMVLGYTGRFLQMYTTHWAWALAYTYVRAELVFSLSPLEDVKKLAWLLRSTLISIMEDRRLKFLSRLI